MKPKEILLTPSAPAKDTDKPRPTNPAVRQWMRERVASWPDEKVAPTEDKDWNAVQQYFAEGLTRDDFRIVRGSETPDAWRKSGPRKPWGRAKN